MWTFTIYGFYSIACGKGPDGTIDTGTVMVRGRVKKHLENLKARFPALANAEILIWPNRDYRYRLILPKAVWGGILREMAEEQEWSKRIKLPVGGRRSVQPMSGHCTTCRNPCTSYRNLRRAQGNSKMIL